MLINDAVKVVDSLITVAVLQLHFDRLSQARFIICSQLLLLQTSFPTFLWHAGDTHVPGFPPATVAHCSVSLCQENSSAVVIEACMLSNSSVVCAVVYVYLFIIRWRKNLTEVHNEKSY